MHDVNCIYCHPLSHHVAADSVTESFAGLDLPLTLCRITRITLIPLLVRCTFVAEIVLDPFDLISAASRRCHHH